MLRPRYVWVSVVAAVVLAGAVVIGFSLGGNSGQVLAGKGQPNLTTTPVLPVPPSGTVAAPANVCGSWSAADGAVGQPIAALYGQVRNCFPVGQDWIITTLGGNSSNGVIAEYSCGNNTACQSGQNPHPLTGWAIYRAPSPGEITLLSVLNTQEILVDVGGQQFIFNVTTHEWRKD